MPSAAARVTGRLAIVVMTGCCVNILVVTLIQVPVVYYLSGLTCSDENFIQKSGKGGGLAATAVGSGGARHSSQLLQPLNCSHNTPDVNLSGAPGHVT